MATTASFRDLALRHAHDTGRATMLPVIEKELLHYEILDSLDQHGYLDHLHFQGGTCLRLCYGSERYSEDLDFAGGTAFTAAELAGIGQIIQQGITNRYGVEVRVEPPSKSQQTDPLTVDTWRISVETAPARPDLPRQRISIQVANVPAHTSQVRPLKVNYPELPASYSQTLVVAEAPEEICADKLKAFITSGFIRYRDIWDLRWLSVQPNFNDDQLDTLLAHKLSDYQAQERFQTGLIRLRDLDLIVNSRDFNVQLSRFLPAPTVARTIARPAFRASLVEEVVRLYRRAGWESF